MTNKMYISIYKTILFIVLTLLSFSVYCQEFDFASYNRKNEEDVEQYLQKMSLDPLSTHWEYLFYDGIHGQKVMTLSDETIVFIGWYNDDEKINTVYFENKITMQTQGQQLGYYIQTLSKSGYTVYCHLNPSAESTLKLVELLKKGNSVGFNGVPLGPGIIIGEMGTTGYSPFPNVLIIKHDVPIKYSDLY